jgi:hypothetical protein
LRRSADADEAVEHVTSQRAAIAIWVTVVLVACAASYIIDEGASLGSRLPVLIGIALVGRLVLRSAGVDRSALTSRHRRYANIAVVAMLAAVSVPVLTAAF